MDSADICSGRVGPSRTDIALEAAKHDADSPFPALSMVRVEVRRGRWERQQRRFKEGQELEQLENCCSPASERETGTLTNESELVEGFQGKKDSEEGKRSRFLGV